MKVMVPLANGFEEIEAFTVVDVLRRAGIEVEMVGVVGSVIEGAHKIKVMVDKRFNEINPKNYDAIVLPGGPGYKTLERTSQLIDAIKEFDSKGKVIGAICAAPAILAHAGLLDEKRATIYPGMEKELSYPRGNKVVVDQHIITSQAPGTAMEFAIALVKKLKGDAEALRLKKELVVE
ncbi:MAG: DJ-1/PfpI family protein [Candidatus Aenigmatarchaeota archaeon]